MVSLTISSASKPPPFARGFPLTVDVPDNATIADVKAAIAAKFPKVTTILLALSLISPHNFHQFYSSRQKITLKGERTNLVEEKKLSDVFSDKPKGAELQVKDLGPQISWRTVFMVEYVRVDHWIHISSTLTLGMFS